MHLARTEPAPRWIVVAAEPITDVDTTAADVLFELDRVLDERGQTIVFAELKDPVRRKIDRYGLDGRDRSGATSSPPSAPPSTPSARRPARSGPRRHPPSAAASRRGPTAPRRPASAPRSPAPHEPGMTAPPSTRRGQARRAGQRDRGRTAAHGQRPQRRPVQLARSAAARPAVRGAAAPAAHPGAPCSAPGRTGAPTPRRCRPGRSARRSCTTHLARLGPEQPALVGAVQQADRLPRRVHPDGDDAQRPAVEPGPPARPGEVGGLVRVVADQQRLRPVDDQPVRVGHQVRAAPAAAAGRASRPGWCRACRRGRPGCPRSRRRRRTRRCSRTAAR